MVPFLDAFLHLRFSKKTHVERGWVAGFFLPRGDEWTDSRKYVVDCEIKGGRGVDPGDRLKILKFI